MCEDKLILRLEFDEFTSTIDYAKLTCDCGYLANKIKRPPAVFADTRQMKFDISRGA